MNKRVLCLGMLAVAALTLAYTGAPRLSAQAPAAILPGKDIRPQFSEPVRVGIILKLVKDVYEGNPLPFPKDGVVFENRQKLLPAKPLGYYHEYTVLPPKGTPYAVTIGEETYNIQIPKPGNRGAERLIIGGGEVLYYTPDHYATFIQLQVVR